MHRCGLGQLEVSRRYVARLKEVGPGGTVNASGGKDDLFLPGPQYDKNYDAKGNVDIYGAKTVVDPPRPPIELGRQQYTSGPYEESSTLFGQLNPLLPGLAVYGDWRTAVAYNSNNGKDIAQIATRLNVDVDLKLTGTERIHAFFTPLQKNNKFTRYEFGGGDGDRRFNEEFDLNPQTLFFEGDLGSIYSGFSGTRSQIRPAFHCRSLSAVPAERDLGERRHPRRRRDPSRAELAQAGPSQLRHHLLRRVRQCRQRGHPRSGQKERANIYGVTTFIDAFGGYIEAGYGLLQGRDELDGLQTHFLTAAYSRRYFNTVSNSTRVFANFGNGKDDDGFAIISENSLITSLPSTLIPYANFFVGFGNPQPLVDGFGAGILKNVGINFETDALTGYPKLNDTGSDTFGGAIGLTYLFANLGQQLIFEVAMVQPFGDRSRIVPTAIRLRRSLSDRAQPGLAAPRRCDLSDPRGRRRQLRRPHGAPEKVLTDRGRWFWFGMGNYAR